MNSYNIVPYIRYSVYRKCPASGWEIQTRTIPDHEFVLITDGRGYVTIEGKRYTARPGILFYFCPGLFHSLKSCNENPMRFFGLHFSFTNVQYINNQWTVEQENTVLPLPPVMEIKNYIRPADIMKELNEHYNNKAAGYELVCNGLFMEFLHHILHDFRINNFNYSSRLKIEEAIYYINKNITKRITVNHLAQQVNLSPDYLNCIFKKFTGYPPVKFINKCRVNAAKTMLAEENKKVKEVAALLGFKDEFYFSRVFKKVEGISPLEFIKKSAK